MIVEGALKYPGWHIMATSTSSKAPARIRSTFPPPLSSAGQPSTVSRADVTPARCRAILMPTPAPMPTWAIRLCPQACPISGRASYSHRTPTLSFAELDPNLALNAVGTLYSFSTYRKNKRNYNEIQSSSVTYVI